MRYMAKGIPKGAYSVELGTTKISRKGVCGLVSNYCKCISMTQSIFKRTQPA